MRTVTMKRVTEALRGLAIVVILLTTTTGVIWLGATILGK